jgi:hypothetical protein
MYVHRASALRPSGRWAVVPRWVLVLAAAAALALAVAGAFWAGARAQREGRLGGVGQLAAHPFLSAKNLGAAHLAADEPPVHVLLDVKFKHYQTLLEKREEALRRGFLFREDGDFVPGDLRVGQDTIPVRLRLKGDLLDHLRGERWSFRIQVTDGRQFLGMRRFSIQHPRTRGFVWEWAVLEALRREDILAPRYGFLEVTLNGKHLGLYAYEEHFGKELLESQSRREGVIVKFDEEWRWEEMYASGERTRRFMLWDNALIEAFNEDALREKPGLLKLYEAAVANLESFRQGAAAACDVFDCERVARFWAVADLTGAAHGLHWINLRFYYNPVTTRLEPVAFDCLAGNRLAHLAGTGALEHDEELGHDGLRARMMADARFARLYVQALQRVSDPAYVEALRADLAPGVARSLQAIHREWPWEDLDWNVLEHNRTLIRAYLDPPAALAARWDPQALREDHLRLRVANLLAFPVEILGAAVGQPPVELAPSDAAQRVLAGKPARGALEWTELTWMTAPEVRAAAFPPPVVDANGTVEASPATMLPVVSVRHRIVGEERVRETPVALGAPEIALQGVPAADAAVTRGEIDYLAVDAGARRIDVREGTWSVGGDLVIPPGWRLAAGPGTRLEFDEGAVLLSHSPVELVGTGDRPVTLAPKGTSWGGLQVIGAGDRSLLQNVTILGTSGVDRPGWTLVGGVTFYESPVSVVDSLLAESRGEDALNVIRSSFTISGCLVRDTAFDAIDVDFGQGEIEGLRFQRIGNDALDFSGSEARVSDLVVLEAGDKGVSVGEASDVVIDSARIEKVGIGVAAKDRSQIRLRGGEIVGAGIGVAAYQKKPEFGSAFAYLQGTTLRGNERDFLVEVGSVVEIDGRTIPGDQVGVADVLY